MPEGRRIRFRIGINLGDVIAEGDDIFGDGVNVAARLEGLAAPGGICVSGTVRDHIGDRLPYAFMDKGEQSVKNIVRPVRAYAWRPEGTADLPTTSVPIAVPMRGRRMILTTLGVAGAALLVTAVFTWWVLAGNEIPFHCARGGRSHRLRCEELQLARHTELQRVERRDQVGDDPIDR